ncbi:MAG: hypothetical protein ACPGVO_19110 [Spirulinaceae cyanobacterium]
MLHNFNETPHDGHSLTQAPHSPSPRFTNCNSPKIKPTELSPTITKLLQDVIEQLQQLPPHDQNRIAYRLLDELEELLDIHAYDAAKQANDEAIPFEQAIREIESA